MTQTTEIKVFVEVESDKSAPMLLHELAEVDGVKNASFISGGSE